MQAFLNNDQLKQSAIARLRALRADGTTRRFWQQKAGCVLGLTIQGRHHDDYESVLGIPVQLAIIEDRLFEGLTVEHAEQWPLAFMDAIIVGADLEKARVWSRYAACLLDDSDIGAIRFAKTEQARDAIRNVSALFRGGCNDSKQWITVADIAHTARRAGPQDDPSARVAADAAACPKCTALVATVAQLEQEEPARRTAYLRQAARLLQMLREAA